MVLEKSTFSAAEKPVVDAVSHYIDGKEPCDCPEDVINASNTSDGVDQVDGVEVGASCSSVQHEAPKHSKVEISIPLILPAVFTNIKRDIIRNAHDNLHEVRNWISHHSVAELPFAWKSQPGCESRIIVVSEDEHQDIWYIGDLHGDLLACVTALRYILDKNPAARIVLLGDVIDRQPYGLEVFVTIIWFVIKFPGQILWLAGNHDIGLRYVDETKQFISSVEPSEFSEWLNLNSEYYDIGAFFIDVTKNLPRALFLSDGLCVVHGGVPGREQQESIQELNDLSSPVALDAYVSNRINPDKPRARGHELGWENVGSFLEKASRLLGFKVSRILRGHDHCEKDRFLFYDQYKANPVLTFVSLSAWTVDEWYFKKHYNSIATSLIVAHHKYSSLPEIVELTIPKRLLLAFWGETPDNKNFTNER